MQALLVKPVTFYTVPCQPPTTLPIGVQVELDMSTGLARYQDSYFQISREEYATISWAPAAPFETIEVAS